MLEGTAATSTILRHCRISTGSSRTTVLGRISFRLLSSSSRSSGILHSLEDLLTDHKSTSTKKANGIQPKPTETTQESPGLSKPTPEIIPKFKYLEYDSSTSERWRRHDRLGSVPKSRPAHVGEAPVNEPQELFEEAHFLKSDRKHLERPHQDKFRAQRKLNYLSNRMKSFVQVLTTPTADTLGTTLLLHFDAKRYLIGSLGEGTQRATVQAGARLLKVSECFITGRSEWSNLGGMMGMILTLADMSGSSRASGQEEAKKRAQSEAMENGVAVDSEEMANLEEQAKLEVARNTLTFFAPPNTEHTLATARRFIFRKGMPVSMHEFRGSQPSKAKDEKAKDEKAKDEEEWAPYWADQNIKVWPMSIVPSSTSSTGSQHKSASPKKRSIEEVYADEKPKQEPVVATDELTESEHGQLTAKAVVAEMFDSSWRLDTLHPTRLADVNMPAAIFQRNPDTNKIEQFRGPFPNGKTPLPDPNLEVLVRKPWPGAAIQRLPHTQPVKESMSYIIRNHTQRGKFNPKNATDLKVKKGQLWAKLAAGQSVLNDDGQTITPDQVLGKSKEGGGLAIIDLPDQSYIDNLVARPEWREPKIMAGVGAVVWMCGAGVATDERLKKFMRDLDKLEHVISSPDYCANNIAFDSAAASTIRLAMVDDKRYKVPAHDRERAVKTHSKSPLPQHATHAVRGLVVQLEPKVAINTGDTKPPLDVAATKAEMSQEVLEEAAAAKKAVRSDNAALSRWAESLPDPNVEITTLGTGSALPSKYRNVSATLMRVPGWGNMLFDCGENTIGQLRRVFPPEEFDEVLRNLRMISISHMHADHHLGTVGVIKAWYELVHNAQPIPLPSSETDTATLFQSQDRLVILGEATMMHWLHEYAAVEDYGFSRLAPLSISAAFPYRGVTSRINWFVPPSELAKASDTERETMIEANAVEPALLGLEDVQSCRVKHCHGARAISITWPSGFKASYSGDCRPARDFVRIGKGSTVCIHEATFDDELQGDAEAKNHSTTSEALGVAQGMGARACILTHFSQRYQKLPVMEHGNGDADEGAAVAQDVPMLNEDDHGAEEETSLDPGDNMPNPLADATAPDRTYKQHDAEFIQQTGKLGEPSMKRISTEPAVKFKLQSDMKVCVAFDYMRVRLGDLAELQHFTPALVKLFAEDEKREGNSDDTAVEEEKKAKDVKASKLLKQEKQRKKLESKVASKNLM